MRSPRLITALVIITAFPSCFADYDKVGSNGSAGTAGIYRIQADAGRAGGVARGGGAGGSDNGRAGSSGLDNTNAGMANAGVNSGGRETSDTAGSAGTGAALLAAAGSGFAGSAGNGAVSCGKRDCSSSLDNDCLNGPDDAEVNYCQCAVPNEATVCNTGQPGKCSKGSTICVFAANKTISTRSACVAPAAGLRDCHLNSDNNCDGNPDNTEPDCGGCSETAPACTLKEDGIGTCKAGTPTKSYSADGSTCKWECAGRQEATGLEICGPLTTAGTPTPDVGCDGVAGNGASCGLALVRIFRGPAIGTPACSCNDSTSYAYANYVARVAPDPSPGSSWTEVTQFMLFKSGPLLGTVPVQNCVDGSNNYVTVGQTCPYGTGTIIGYVSSTQAAGYVQLKQFSVGINSCTSHGSETARVPAGLTALNLTLTASLYYTVPIPTP